MALCIQDLRFMLPVQSTSTLIVCLCQRHSRHVVLGHLALRNCHGHDGSAFQV